MGRPPKFIDPADQVEGVKQDSDLDSKEEKVSFKRLTLADFKSIPKRSARVPAAFEGYPAKIMTIVERQEDVKGNESSVELTVNATHLISMSPTFSVEQDISGEGIPIQNKDKEVLRVATIETTHNRIVSYRGNAVNVVFDRKMEVDMGNGNVQIMRYAVVPNPIHRAMICYFWDAKKEAMDVDPRYMLVDGDQVGRLRRVFMDIQNPKLHLERRMDEVFYGGTDTTKMVDLPGIPEAGVE